MRRTRGHFPWTIAGALALGLGACSDGLGPEGTGEARVFLGGTSSGAQAAMASVLASVGSSAEVTLDDVEAIEVEITGLQAVLEGEDEEDEGGWVDLQLSAAAVSGIDLMSLPGGGVEIAAGDLTAGAYGNVRIFFGSATITLRNDVTVGTETFAAADSPHELFIPSGAQTGIKIPTAGFEVAEDATESLVIEFDPALSVQTVAATAAGLLMEPVLAEGDGS